MTLEEKITRINALYRKSQAEGLTDEERREQKILREEYVANIRANLRGQLNAIDVCNADGTVTNLGEKFGRKLS